MPLLLKDKINEVYHYSTDIGELEAACAEIDAYVNNPVVKRMSAATEEDGKEYGIHESLSFRIRAKYMLLRYASGFTADNYQRFKSFVLEAIDVSEEKKYTKTLILCASLRDYVDELNEVMSGAIVDIDRVRDENNMRTTEDTEFISAVLDRYRDRISTVEQMGFMGIFPEAVIVPNVSEIALSELRECEEWINNECSASVKARMNKLIEQSTTPVSELGDMFGIEHYECRLCNSPSQIAGTVVISTPFDDEALLCARACGNAWGNEFRRLDVAAVMGKKADEIAAFFDALGNSKSNIIIMNLGDPPDEVFEPLAIGILRAGRRGAHTFVLDKQGDHSLYERFDKVADTTEGVTTLDVTHEYLKMPLFDSVINILIERGKITNSESDNTEVRTTLPFMGYVGFNKLLAGEHKGIIAVHSDENRDKAIAYLSRLVAQNQLIDPDWGDYSGNLRIVEGKRVEFDYDGFKDVDRNNLKIIMETPGISSFAKCGAAVKYCLLAGDDMSAWERLDNSERSDRINLATVAVARLLNTENSPRVEVLSDEEWAAKAEEDDSYKGNTVGLCINKGKLIHYKESYLNTADRALRVICHECFHSFQHTLCDTKHASWHFIELGVTKGRVDAWSKNFSKYASKGLAYEVEIVEMDAEAFVYDCLEAIKTSWQKINFVK